MLRTDNSLVLIVFVWSNFGLDMRLTTGEVAASGFSPVAVHSQTIHSSVASRFLVATDRQNNPSERVIVEICKRLVREISPTATLPWPVHFVHVTSLTDVVVPKNRRVGIARSLD